MRHLLTPVIELQLVVRKSAQPTPNPVLQIPPHTPLLLRPYLFEKLLLGFFKEKLGSVGRKK